MSLYLMSARCRGYLTAGSNGFPFDVDGPQFSSESLLGVEPARVAVIGAMPYLFPVSQHIIYA